MSVAKRLSCSEFAGGFNFHKIIFEGNHGWLNELRDSERIVHGKPLAWPVLLKRSKLARRIFPAWLTKGFLRGLGRGPARAGMITLLVTSRPTMVSETPESKTMRAASGST